MDDNTSRITNLVNDLVVAILPENTSKYTIQNCHSYSLRLLSSRINSKSVEDENLIRTNFHKRIQKKAEEQNMSKQTLNGMSLRMQELLQSLNKKKVLKRKWSVCYLLSKISETTDLKQSSIISPLDGIVKAKLSERWKTNNNSNNSIKQGAMEIESTGLQSSSSNVLASRPEPQSNLSKLITKVSNKGNAKVSENDLIRDALYAFQGIDGNYINYSDKEDAFVLKPEISLSDPVKRMMLHLCEMGWLYRRVVRFIEASNVDSRGLVHQSLCFALKEELNEYYRLIAVLENLRNADDELLKTASFVDENAGERSLNLRKLYLWSIEPFERLKWMSIFCDACAKIKGSVIISTIYGYTKQGSPSIQILVNRVLKYVLAPFSNFLKQWVYNGELNDQYGEFFITMDPYVKDDDLWYSKYLLNQENIPGFMDLQLAEKILTTGKSVNFMRRCCAISDWYLDIDFIDLSSAVVSNVNQTLNFTDFKDWVLKSNEITSKALLSVMFEKFKLMQHFEAIRRFILFGQGDFIQYLMDALVLELLKPATSIYKHNLSALMDTAIRSSNAQFIDNDFMSRVEVKLLEPQPGDKGWEVFSMTYRVESPLTTVLNGEGMRGYLRLFNFLWRMKRIEHALNSLWVQQKKGAYLMDQIKEFRPHLHKCNLLRNEMSHYVGNLMNYLMIEVIESAWTTFTEEIKNAKDLDEVIKYHEKFVNSMLDKALLTQKNDKLFKQMIKLFDQIWRFQYAQEALISSVQEENHKRRARRNQRDMDRILGEDEEESEYGRREDSIEIESYGEVNLMQRRETLNSLLTVSRDYKKAFTEFMDLLRDDSLGGKLRFLSFRLDFNEYYSAIHPQNLMMMDKRLEDFKIDNKKTRDYGDYEYSNPRPETYSKIATPPQYTKDFPVNVFANSHGSRGSHYSGGDGDEMEEEKTRPVEYGLGPLRTEPKPISLSDINVMPGGISGISGGLGGLGGGMPKYQSGNLNHIHESMERMANMLRDRNKGQGSESGAFDPPSTGRYAGGGIESNSSFLKDFGDWKGGSNNQN